MDYKPVNIVVSNGWSDDNKGDSAIVEGLLEVIKQEVGECRFSMISSFSADSSHFSDSTRHLSKCFDLKVFSHPVWHRCPFKRTSRIVRLLDCIKSALLLMAPSIGAILLTEDQRRSLEVLKRADLVVAKGGHYLFGGNSVGGLFTLFSNAYTLLLANRMGVRTALSANSVGPFVGRRTKWLAGYVFRKIDVIQLREMKSVRLVTELGVAKVAETFDTAFVVEGQDPKVRLPENYMVITSRQWDFPYDPDNAAIKYEKYLNAMVDAAVFSAQQGLDVVIAPQVTGPTSLEDDRVINRILRERILSRGVDPIVLEDDFSPGQLKSIYGSARFLIGTRFHSAILALSGGTPVIVFSYHGPKAPGIMEQFGLQRYVFDIDSAESSALINACRSMLDSQDAVRRQIQHTMGTVRGRIRKDVLSIVGTR